MSCILSDSDVDNNEVELEERDHISNFVLFIPKAQHHSAVNEILYGEVEVASYDIEIDKGEYMHNQWLKIVTKPKPGG